MRHKKLILTLVFLFGLGLQLSKAQYSVNTAGGNTSDENGSVSYSIGQIVYSAYAESDGKVSEGVQQPYEIFLITSVEELEELDLELTVFPNPVVDQLHLIITVNDFLQLSDLHYRLLDLNGKTLKSQTIISDISLVNMSGKQPGIYFLQVNASGENIGLFKIIKR